MAQRIQTTAATMASLSVLMLCTSYAIAQTDDDRLQQLEQQVTSLQSQLSNTNATEDRLRFNGFLSLLYGVSNNDAGYAGYNKEGTFQNESLFGLQGSFTLSDKTDVTMQLVGRGSDDWDPSMEWAYISHQFTPALKMRAGKMRIPFFMYSDSLDVGYAQPWARPPIEVYNGIPITNYTGVDALYDINLDNSTLTLQGFGGETRDTVAVTGDSLDIALDNLYGAVVNWTNFTWALRTNYAEGDLDLNGETYGTRFVGMGFNYNDGVWQIVSEITSTEVEGPITDDDSGYITLARSFGSLSPYVTYAMRESTDDEDRPLTRAQVTTPGSPVFGLAIASDIENVNRTSYSVGLRWDVMSNVAIKFDVTRATDFGDTGGGLEGNVAPAVIYDDADIYSIKIDSAF